MSHRKIDKDKAIRKKRKRNLRIRQIKNHLILYVVVFVMLYLCVRIWDIQFVEGVEKQYRKVATVQQASLDKSIIANRGAISDRNGEMLALSTTVYDVILDIQNMFDPIFSEEEINKNINKNINVLSSILDIDKEEIAKYYEIDPETNKPKYIDYMYLKIASKVPYDAYKEILEENLRSVYLMENTKRTYPKDNLASQIVGFLRGDYAYDYYGLENNYNDYLLGVNGRKFSTFNKNGENYVDIEQPIDGNTVQTTLDTNIQRVAEEVVFEYSEEYKAQNGAIIVMKADTSEILAMAQYPTFNANEPGKYAYFNKTTFVEDYEKLIDNGEESEAFESIMSVWNNFSISSTFEPGSTYKPSVIAAALEEKVISPTDTIFCNGNIEVQDKTIRCWNIYGHGTQTPLQVLENSCNVGMIIFAEKMGPDLFLKYQEDFGFGHLTGIDLPGEVSASNIIYNIEDLRNSLKLATSSMGQGFNSTALQSINAFASIVNGGNLMKPYIVSEIVDENGKVVFKNEPTLIRKTISKDTSDFLRVGMQNVVEIGTGKNARIPGYTIGGKTGTAEQGDRTEENETVSFIGYFPVENPEYIVMSVLHLPEIDVSGGAQAAPMAREVMEYIIEYYSIAPSKDIENQTNIVNSEQIITPDLIGYDVDEAVEQLINLGLDFQVYDSGQYVVKTFPESNTILSKDGAMLIYSGDKPNENTEVNSNEEYSNENKPEDENANTADIEKDNSEDEETESTSKTSLSVSSYLDAKELVSVPDIIDLDLENAISSLEYFDFNYKIYVVNGEEEQTLEKEGSKIYSDENPEELLEIISYSDYKVVRQSHKEGISTPKNSTIKIVVEKIK